MADFCYWDHLPDLESVQQFDAFSTYRELGPGRTLVATAEHQRQPYGTIVKWAQLGAWKERAEAFDVHYLAERSAALEARRKVTQATWSQRRAELLEGLEEIATVGISRLAHDLKNRHANLRPNELRLIVETIAKWQNLAHGDATEKLDLGLDLSQFSVEELEQFLALQTKAQTPADAGEV